MEDYSLDYDSRFPFLETNLGKILVSKIRKFSIKYQKEQQKKVENYFIYNKTISINNFLRNPKWEWEFNLEEFLSENNNKNNVIILLSWIINPQDIVQSMPDWIVKMWLVWLSISEFKWKIKNILEKWTISWYVINSIEEIKKNIYSNEDINVIIIRNAIKEDLKKAILNGWENSTLVVWWHWSFNSLSLTDWIIKNEEIPIPENKLKAFIQHTCAWWKWEELGIWWANNIFWWKRWTSPVDFILDPLHKR